MSINRMTNKFLILGLAVVSALSSCTTDDILAPDNFDPDEVMDPNHVEVRNSNYEIQLSGGGSNSMRTIFETTEEDKKFYTGDMASSLGVFCLAYDKLSDSNLIPDVSWASDDANIKKFNVWMNNVEANTFAGNENGNIPGKVYWTKDAKKPETPIKYYYPMGGWYKYAFYSYFPRVSNTKVSIENGDYVAVAQISIDGRRDVLWGKTWTGSPYAYSAKFFHQEDNRDTIPMLSMRHVLARLRFQAVAGESSWNDGKEETVADQEIEITDIRVLNVPNEIGLVVAHSSQKADQEGVLVPSETAKMGSYVLKESDDTPFAKGRYKFTEQHVSEDKPMYLGGNDVDTSAQPTGDGILLPPIDENADPYTIQVTMTDNSGESIVQVVTLETPKGGFKAGVAYWVKITINARKEISLEATLAPWEEGETLELEF